MNTEIITNQANNEQEDASQAAIASKNTKLCRLYAMGTIVLWCTPFVFTRVALGSYSNIAIGVLRCVVASIALIIAAFFMKIGLPQKSDIPKFFLSGAAGFGIYMIIFNKALETITSATGSVIIATAPIITAILAILVFKEKISIRGWIAISLEFTGIIVLTLWNGILSVNTGILWMLLSAFLVSIYNITQRIYTKKYTAFQSTTYSIWAGTILLLPFLPATLPQIGTASLLHTGVVLFLAIFSTCIAYILWSKALSLAEKTSDVTNFMFVTPLLAAILGYLVLRETLSISTLIGGSIIIAGLILFNLSKK